MPLFCGRKNVSRNIRELMRTGKFHHKQAVAIALNHQRKCLGQAPYRSRKPKGRKKNTTKRGFKKCVLTMLMKTRVRKNLCLYRCLNEAIRKCK